MPLAGLIHCYDIDDCKIRMITTDTASTLTYGDIFDAPGIQEMNLDVSMVEGESYGDGRVLDRFARVEKVSGSVKMAKLSHSLFAAIFAGQTIPSGTTPNQKLETAIGPNNLPYFEIDFQTLYTGPDGVAGGDAHAVVHRAKVKSFKVGRKMKDYQEVSFDWEGIPLNHLESGWNFRRCLTFAENETLETQTEGTPDLTVPSLTTTPADGASGVSVSANLTAVSDVALLPASVNAGSVLLMTAAGVEVANALTLSTDGFTITLNPNSNLSSSTGYRFVISKNVRSVAGVQLAANVIVDFTTA